MEQYEIENANEKGTSKVSQEPPNVVVENSSSGSSGSGKKKSDAEEFDAWLNESSGSGSGMAAGEYGDFYSLKNDGDRDILVFHHNADNPPKHAPRDIPDIEDPTKKKTVQKVILKISRLEEPNRFRTWELAPKHVKLLWREYLSKGVTTLEVTRIGKKGDSQTTYSFKLYLTPEQQRLLFQQKPQQQLQAA